MHNLWNLQELLVKSLMILMETELNNVIDN